MNERYKKLSCLWLYDEKSGH